MDLKRLPTLYLIYSIVGCLWTGQNLLSLCQESNLDSTMSVKQTSEFSSTMIGMNGSSRNAKAREIFESEASEVSTYLRGVHHSRKIAHRQVNYSDTVAKLGKFQQEVPVYLQKTDTIPHSATQSFGNTANGFQMQAYTDKMGTYILQEKDMNDRKRLYNREVGRKAIVNEVISGTAAIPKKQLLFPHKATHTQILALAGTLKAPDARIIPPRIERGKKWLGDGVGWDK